MQAAIKNFTSDPRRMFLIDALGATVSAGMLGLVLVHFQEYIGMPLTALKFLSGVALVIALFSWGCYLRYKSLGKSLLKAIGPINLFYCLLSACFVIFYLREMTSIGYWYFVIEILIIAMIAVIEIKVARAQSNQ